MKNEKIDRILEGLNNLGEVIESESVHRLKGDGTNWTIADSLEDMAHSLNRMADTLEKICLTKLNEME